MGDSKHDAIDFEELFDSSSGMIFNLGMRLFRNEEDALDFAQDAYMRAYDKLDSYRGEARPSTWLYSLALNLGLNRLKKQKRLKLKELPEDQSWTIEDLESGEDDPLEKLTDSEMESIVREELNQLADVYRIPLILYYFDRLAYRDIAERLGIKEGTLKSYLHRGKVILRERLLRREVETT
ncbi:MAG: sigma-70 family RNA polymerase sigma factor [bacterium]|nr:sigma-70 family RNA polymerase sigma factor [bacterium]